MIKEKVGMAFLKNKKYKDWTKNLDEYELEKSINWNLAIIKK